uniref:Uncharacterized protein n=1 Tax=Arundo donax TaxID=35708 RepID=A0A0A9B9X0_ARUDO
MLHHEFRIAGCDLLELVRSLGCRGLAVMLTTLIDR